MADRVESIIGRWEDAKRARSPLNGEFEDIARLLHPQRIGFQGEMTKGGRRGDDAYDSTAAQARWQLAAATEGFVVPKGENWLEIGPEDEDLLERPEVKRWFGRSTSKTYESIYAPSAHFHNMSEETLNDAVGFGSGAYSMRGRYGPMGERPCFGSIHLANAHWATNEHGDVDTFWIKCKEPVRNAARTYGFDALGKTAQNFLKEDKFDKEIELLHFVAPRHEIDYRREDNLSFPWQSCVVDVTDKKLTEESGYHELPYGVVRWGTVSGEPWGWSLARMLLPDVKMLNQQAKTTLKVGHQVADPPLLIPHSGIIDWDACVPGGRATYDVDSAVAAGGRIPVFPLATGANYPISREMTQDTRDRLWQGFLKHVLNLPVDSPAMTATEVIERKKEILRLVGPTFGRLETDFSEVIVRRTFWINFRAGVYGVPPPILRGQSLKFKVASTLAKIKKEIEAASVVRTMEIISPLVPVKPDILDNYDMDKIARGVGEALMPAEWVRSPDDVEAIRAERAEQQEAQAKMQQAAMMAEMAGRAAPMVKAVA